MNQHPPKSLCQKELYHELMRPDGGYPTITREQWDIECAKREYTSNWDYLITSTLEGVEYWLPNDEDWFYILAVDHTHRLAAHTGFMEMDDFDYEDSEYRFTLDPTTGSLRPKFQHGQPLED